MNLDRLLRSVLASVIFLAAAGGVPAAVTTNFGDEGLSSICVDGVERLQSGMPGIWRMRNADGKPISTKQVSRAFDKALRTLTTTYEWGSIGVSYEPVADGLDLKVAIHNTSAETISELGGLTLLKLKGLGKKLSDDRIAFGVEGPPWTYFRGEQGGAIWLASGEEKPLAVELRADPKKDDLDCRITLGGGRLILDNILAERPIAPGATETIHLRLRLAPAGVDPLSLISKEIEAYRKAYPSLLNWPDHRPILRLFFGGGLGKEEALARLKDPENVQMPEPDPKFQQRILKRMRDTVETAKAINAQAVIIWDLEGDTFPHATTYIGDPRLTRLLNPQMDLVADEALKIITDAGLQVGVTIRPSRVIYNEQKKTATHSHTVAGDPLLELDGKVAYARQRWGCRVFYVDTNYFWRPYGKEQKWTSARIPPVVWRKLKEKYPDTLFIPEFGSIGDYQCVAAYGEADMGNYGTPVLARAIWPEAFRVIVIEDADPAENCDRFVRTVREGNALMTYAFQPTAPNAQFILRFTEEAKLLDTGMPASVQNATPEGLTALLSSRELAERFFAARRLRDEPVASAALMLLKVVTDEKESWVVRRAALLAFAHLEYKPVISVAMDLLLARGSGLYAAAAEALAGQDETVDAVLIEQCRDAVRKGQRSHALEQLGPVLIGRKLSDAIPILEEALAGLPPKDKYAKARLEKIINKLKESAPAPASGSMGHPSQTENESARRDNRPSPGGNGMVQASSKPTWKLVFEDAGTKDWRANWFLDGLKATVKNTAKGMEYASGPIAEGPAKHASNAVLWTRRSFGGDLRVEYDFTRLDTATDHTSVCILYMHATGTGQKPYVRDIFEWRELRSIPTMSKYFNNMNLYHFSYACTGGNDRNYIRARRYPSKGDFDKTTRIKPSYENVDLFKPGETWHLVFEKVGVNLTFTATQGQATHTWTWDASAFPPLTEGRLGLRQMQGRNSRYANFKVFERP